MFSVFHSTILHVKRHWGVALLFILSLSILYSVQLALVSDAYKSLVLSSPFSSDTQSLFTFYLNNASSEAMSAYFDSIAGYKQDLAEVTLEGNMNASEEESGLNGGLSYKLYTFFPSIDNVKNVYVVSGSKYFTSAHREIFINSDIYDVYNSINYFADYQGKKQMTIGGEMYYVIGTGYISKSQYEAEFVVEYDDFYAVTDSCSVIYLQFEEPLDNSAAKHLVQITENSLPVSSIQAPYTFTQEGRVHFFRTMIYYVAAILVCLINVFGMFSYLIKMRSLEFQIYRIVGAPKIYLLRNIMCELLVYSSLSLGIGSFAFLLCDYLLQSLDLFEPLPPLLLAGNIGGYLILSVGAALLQYKKYIDSDKYLLTGEIFL